MPAKSAGFSLVELMVAVALSSFLLLGVVEIYVSNKQSNNLQNGFSQVQENGRMVVEILSREIRRADFWGCLADSQNIEVNLDVTDPDVASLYDFGNGGVGGANDVSSADIGGQDLVDGTDTLIVRGTKGDNIRIMEPYMPTPSADLHVNMGSGIQVDDVLLVSDCTAGNLFQVTSANPDTSGSVTHNIGTGSIGNSFKEFQKSYGADARVLVPYFKVYFIANDVNGQPSLFQSVNGDTDELIPGVENMQITYGEDTDGDLAVEFWRDADAVVDMEQVIAIRVVFSMQSYDSVGSTDAKGDGRIRRDYTVTTNIRNRMI